ncbi:carboxylase [Carbonactinospora thermoautotrophica]|uniref:Carboxylase n=1 Tax=Carbonactinospora thermoautotrophica TaxID=1469144 RepID=A0A132NGP5_9ACTN|nr:acyl-CoA carboxylase subunit beta [Carbonactinospora thermoautotrophica]KWX05592.1 carboxylase [Carbonactinospora thermoautotrophica]KWX09281.1 carboxylase [Carbonactinospora thermoautotrophica]
MTEVVGRDVHAELRRRIEEARRGGPEKNRKKHVESGKLLVRDRLALLFDDGWEFEDGLLARHEEGLPGDAVVTCVGKVDGRDVCVIANDYTVKAGTWGKRTFEKIVRMQEIADATGTPLVYLFDSAGARIDEQFESYAGRHAWGNIFYNQIQISGRVPQVCALFGPSPAGSAYVPALCDFTVMVRGHATAYLGSPRLAEMVTGEQVSLEEMGGAEMHCRVSGLGDCLVEDDEEAIAAIRLWLSYLPPNWQEQPPVAPALPPAPGRTVREIVPERESEVFDIYELIDAVVDEGSFFEYKSLFAPELVTGFARLDGHSVGIIANQPAHRGGVLFPDSSDKAARFIWICNAFNVPLLFLIDIAGYMIGSQVERQGIIRHGAKMLFAVAESRVPRIAVILRKAYGGGYLAMSGAPMQPDAVIALPTAKPALMGPEAAVNAIHFNRIQAIEDPDERARFIAEKRAEYEASIDVFKIANENAVEAVVPAEELRDELIRRFRVYRRRPATPPQRRNGVFPV